MKSDHSLIDAVREVLGLEPLYRKKSLRAELAWADACDISVSSSGIDWEDNRMVAEDGTSTIPMRERISAQARRAMRHTRKREPEQKGLEP
jgi:hypothetical protein